MTIPFPPQTEDDVIRNLMNAGATDDEIVTLVREWKMKNAAPPASRGTAPSVSAPISKGPQLSGFTRREALPSFGDLPKGVVEGAKESLSKLTGFIAQTGMRMNEPEAKVSVPSLPAAKSTSEAIGRMGGQILGELPLSMATSGVVNPLVSKTAGKLLGPVATKAAQKIASSTAMQDAISVGITTIPQEIIAGSIAEAIVRPESFGTWQSSLRTGMLSSIGSVFNAGFAYRNALKNATTPAEVLAVKEQFNNVIPATPAVSAGTTPSVRGDTPLYSAVDLASLRQYPTQQGGQLPTAREAAWRRMEQTLNEEADLRLAQLQSVQPPKQVDVIAEAAKNQPKDPLVLAAMKGMDERLKAVLTRTTRPEVQFEAAAGKGVQTPTTPDLGVSLPPPLTVDELNDYLRVLNMATIGAEPQFKKGQRFILPRTQLPTAEEIAARATGGPIKRIDPTIQKQMQDVQRRLDAAAAVRNGTLDPEETQQIVKEMLDMSTRLQRGFEVPRTNVPRPTGTPAPAALRQVAGWDLPNISKINEPTFAAESKAAVDDSYKRWVTGSDAPVEGTAPPIPPPEIQAATAISYAESVRDMNIDYTPQQPSLFNRLASAIGDAKTNFYDRTIGIGKYSQRTRDMLQLLSGIPEYAEQFATNEMRIASRNADGTMGQTVVQGRPLAKILDDLSGPDEVREFDAYLKARTSLDSKAANPDFTLDRPIEQFQAIADNAPSKIKNLGAEFKIIADALVDDAVALGRVAPDAAEKYKDKFYAGLTRVFNNGVTQQSLLKRVGSLRASRSPSQLMRDNIYGMLNKSRRNAAYANLINDFEKEPMKYAGVIEPADAKAGLYDTPGYKEMVTELQEKAGMGIKEAEDIAGLMAPGLDRTDGTLVVYRNGVPSFWKVNDDIKKTMDSLNPFEIGLFRSVLAGLSVPTRRLTSLGLDLSGIGPASDAILTTMAVPKFIPVVDNLRGMYHSLLKTEMYKERVAAGGAYGGRFTPGEELDKLMLSSSGIGKAARKAGEIVAAPLTIAQAIIRPLSDASRMGEYLVRRQRLGESAAEAALGSRKTLGDFNRVGALLRGWSLITEFGNVGIQTSAAAAQALRTAATELKKGNVAPATRLASTLTAGITVPTVYFWSLAQDDEELNAKRLSDTGYRNWWFRSPVNMKIGDVEIKEGEILKTPKLGWWAGQTFGSGVEAMLDGFSPEDRKRLADGFIGQVGMNVVPLYAQKLAGMATGQRNVNISTMLGTEKGIPITPRGQEGLDPRIQGNERTTPLGLAAGEAGINPFMADYALETVGGNLFSSVVRNLGDTPVKLEKSDLPVFGRFFTSSRTPTEGSDMFYKDLEEAKNADKSFNKAVQTGQIEDAKKILAENQRIIALRKPLEAMSAEMSEMNSLMLTVMNDDKFSAEAKREYINNIRKKQQELFMMYAKARKMYEQ